jgi:peptide/nickel transport system permease protein
MSVAQVADTVVGPSTRAAIRRGASLDLVAYVCAGFLAVAVLVMIVGPWLAPHNPNAINLADAFANPSFTHLLGTDDLGRDLLSRLLVGTRTSLLAPMFVVLLATTVGTVVAISAAWIGGFYDTVVSRGLDILFSFPGLILAILAVAVFGQGLVAPVIALSVTYMPLVALVLRTAALRESNLPYVDALYVQGARSWSICARHILPNLMPLILVQATIGYGYAMLDLAAISYLGLGLQPPSADWGLMISNGQASILGGHPQQSLYASLLVVATVVSVNLIGERIAAHFEVDER